MSGVTARYGTPYDILLRFLGIFIYYIHDFLYLYQTFKDYRSNQFTYSYVDMPNGTKGYERFSDFIAFLNFHILFHV